MSLIGKLKIKTDKPLFIIDGPANVLSLFSEAEIEERLPAKGTIDQAIFFTLDKETLDAKAPSIMKKLSNEGLLWVAYPKKSGSIQSDLIRDEGWDTMYKSDWEGVASASINDDWTGMRFRHKSTIKKMTRYVPPEERDIEDIDFINRTVKLPKDAVAAMRGFKGLEEFFYSLAFTHKKEYVEAIVQAKKPETRVRRIEKMIEMVSKLKEQKEAKAKKK